MSRRALVTALLLCAPFAPPRAHAAEATPIAKPDLAALIECRKEVPDFLALAPAVSDPLKAVALGWKPLPQVNQFMTEFQLAAPITVFGHATDRIAFAGDSIMAILTCPIHAHWRTSWSWRPASTRRRRPSSASSCARRHGPIRPAARP